MRYKEIPRSNLHTHTCFCDGKHTPEETVLAAIDIGMDVLGFSGHSFTSFDLECSMSREDTISYRTEILQLKERYRDRLHILLGIEQDFYGDDQAVGYDYVIGSVHYLALDGAYPSIDQSREELTDIVNRYFEGDFYRMARCYFETVSQIVEKTNCNIVGHFDLLSKFNEGGVLFDENDPRYLRSALDALDTLLEKDVLFEINTGAMSRGYRKMPYPAPLFLHRIAEKRGHVILSSDAHTKDMLLHGFSDAIQIARSAGLGSVEVMTRDGWKTYSL